MKPPLLLSLIFAALLLAHPACPQTGEAQRSIEPRFIADSYKTVDWRQLSTDASSLQHPFCNNHHSDYSDRSFSVGEFIGGGVKSVQVTFVATQNVPLKDSSPLDTVKKVWDGRFQTAECFPVWAEMTLWNTEAVVHFVNGREAKLITDGLHVAFQDQAGRSWFVRLLPSGQ